MALTKISRTLLDTGVSDSSDATAITIDSSERVGIGESSPDELLVIDGDVKIKSTNKLHFTNTSDQTYIHAPASNTLAFGAGSAERMRLASDGDFFLNTTSAMDNCFASFQDGNNGEAMVGISAKNDNNVGIRFGVGTTRKWVNYRDTSDNLIWYSNAASAERVRFYSGGGITFNGDNAAANALDDYEEGTWTPVLIGNDSQSGQAYATQQGTYTKIGRQVCCLFNLNLSTEGSFGNNYILLSGFPFTISSSVHTVHLTNLYFVGMAANYISIGLQGFEGGSKAYLWAKKSATANREYVGTTDLTDSTQLTGQFTYFI